VLESVVEHERADAEARDGVPLYVLAVRLALLSEDVVWRAAFARACRARCP